MKNLIITKLTNPKLLSAASTLNTTGTLATSAKNYFYLKIDDEYIHQLFPLLRDKKIQKPDYFGAMSMGAHISVAYPEENKSIHKDELGKKFHFTIKELCATELGTKMYYILLVESPSLLQLRKKYHLPEKLSFKGYPISFHITIGLHPVEEK